MIHLLLRIQSLISVIYNIDITILIFAFINSEHDIVDITTQAVRRASAGGGAGRAGHPRADHGLVLGAGSGLERGWVPAAGRARLWKVDADGARRAVGEITAAYRRRQGTEPGAGQGVWGAVGRAGDTAARASGGRV